MVRSGRSAFRGRIEGLVWIFRHTRLLRLAIIFAAVFLAAGAAVSLIERGRNPEFETIADGWWWVIVTFSTTGYGDKVPVTAAGKIVAVLTILVGIVAMAVVSGTLASFFVEQNTKARRGLMELKNIQNHFIICGWKDQMHEILLDMLSLSPDLTAAMIVIVSNIESEKIEELRHQKELTTINFVRGDYFSDSALERANVKDARKVLVLSDTYESKASSEIDSKTVMTVLTVKSISRDIYVCAELIDRKYEGYLKQAMCDEIIFTSDFNKRILGSASVISGMSHIIRELLSHEVTTTHLATLDIEPQFVGKPYHEFREFMRHESGRILLGILENTGSPNRMKLDALREAQMTSDVSKLVTNLQSVKVLEVNKPVLIPEDGYVIQKHSRAIVLER